MGCAVGSYSNEYSSIMSLSPSFFPGERYHNEVIIIRKLFNLCIKFKHKECMFLSPLPRFSLILLRLLMGLLVSGDSQNFRDHLWKIPFLRLLLQHCYHLASLFWSLSDHRRQDPTPIHASFMSAMKKTKKAVITPHGLHCSWWRCWNRRMCSKLTRKKCRWWSHGFV